MTYSIDEASEKIIRAGHELTASGLIARTWGNISARISPTQFIITPSGKSYESLKPEDLVIVNIEDGEAPDASGKPSGEKGVHAEAYRLRPDVGFVIHTHQNYATALSVLGRQFHINKLNPKIRKILGPFIPTARYGMSSTKKLADNIAFSINKYPQAKSVLMACHGTVCMGRDYEDAFEIARTLEMVCKAKFRQIVQSDYPKGADSKPYADYEKTVLHRQIHEEYDQHYLTFENEKIGCLIETDAPYIKKMSSYGKNMRVFVDDLAQMAGTTIRCLPPDASEKEIAGALTGSAGAVLIKDRGAICAAGNEEDAEAVVMVLDKGCRAALLDRVISQTKDVRKATPVSRIGGAIEHAFYVAKYSKLKDAEDETC